jgi:hypothetical protein
MKSLFALLLFFSFNNASAFETQVVFKNHLSFTANSLESIDRQNEKFSAEVTDSQLQSLIISTVQKTIQLLPARYLPPRLTVSVERDALFTKTGKNAEKIPLSMVLTFQIPTKNEIRYSDFELQGHPEAARTIIAHETGHMLIEWACRSVGVTKPTDSSVQSSHWVGSIYEGVADYISATVNNTTVIGAPGAWYARDILKFKTLDEAHRGSVSTLKLVEQGFASEGLIPRYQTYVDLLAEFKKEASDSTVGDSYVEAPWLAGQLWELNRIYGSIRVFGAVLEIAVSGEKFTDPEIFLGDVKQILSMR